MDEIRKLLGGIALAALLGGSALANGDAPPKDAKKDAAATKTSCSGGEKAKTSCSGGEKARAAKAAAQAKSAEAAAKPKASCSGGEKTAGGGSSCGKGSCS